MFNMFKKKAKLVGRQVNNFEKRDLMQAAVGIALLVGWADGDLAVSEADKIQKVLANICQARNLHGVPLADGWMVASTGNRQSDRAGANRVLSHLRNRETVVEFETHLDDWCSWAIDHNVKPEVISFILAARGAASTSSDTKAAPKSDSK